jgi:prevent-host-death family protein
VYASLVNLREESAAEPRTDIGARELRRRLSEILDRVERGGRVTVIGRGRQGALLSKVRLIL